MNMFSTAYIQEPDLIFGNKGEDKDPRIGLEKYGPYFYSDENGPLPNVRIGVIGTRENIESTKKILELTSRFYKSPKPNKWLYPDFPGMDQKTSFKCSITTSENWDRFLSEDNQLKKIEKIANPNVRIAFAANLYSQKVKEIRLSDDFADVIICVLPKVVEDYCGISEKTRGAKSAKPTQLEKKINELRKESQTFLTQWGFEISDEEKIPEKGFDFRNSLKGKVMEYDIPIQILRESTIKHVLGGREFEKASKQDPSSFFWNFSTALYYKAKGKPWRLAKLRDDTCYIGISFFKDKLQADNDVQISMAQIFTHSGEGLVLRGSEVEVDERTKQPYLKKREAKSLLKKALSQYVNQAGRTPARVVIHKSSSFSEGEKDGFNEAIYELGNISKDFVSIRPGGIKINFLRLGNYPVLRGTMISLGKRDFLLYTSGYSPRIRTYAGHKIPNPLYVFHQGDSSRSQIAKEILDLTKLNWNTTSFSTFKPITISFAGDVGKILSELPAGRKIQHHYRFFM